jgi:CHAT domain-containing protein
MLPTLTAFPLLAPAGGSGDALCVGDPVGMTYRRTRDDIPRRLPALPGAGVEAAVVARTLGVVPLVGDDAIREKVTARLRDAGVVHLATHGIVDPESPLASALVLAHGEQLTVAEVLSLRLTADLVVLSACETGTGEPVGGDELLGLGRALLAAGARAAIVSLWPVDDEVSAVLMTDFHLARAGGLATADALRHAVAQLRRRDPHEVRQEFRRLAREVEESTGPAVPVGSRSLTTAPPRSAVIDHPQLWAPFIVVGSC